MNNKISFNVDIAESAKIEKDFIIRGVAINATTTRNGVTYTVEELSKSAQTLQRKPILKDHKNSVDSIVGRTTENVYFDPMNENIKFEAIIVDEQMQNMIREGMINAVSIGAMVQEIEKVESEESVKMVARGIDFVELSLVAVPADKNAGFTAALAESFDLTQTTAVVNENLEEKQMAEEKSKLELLREERAALEEELEQMKIEKLKLQKEELATEEQPEEEEEKAEEEPEAAEEEAEAEAKEESVKVEDKTKGQVAQEMESSEDKYKIYTSEVAGTFGVSIDYDACENLVSLKRRY